MGMNRHSGVCLCSSVGCACVPNPPPFNLLSCEGQKEHLFILSFYAIYWAGLVPPLRDVCMGKSHQTCGK